MPAPLVHIAEGDLTLPQCQLSVSGKTATEVRFRQNCDTGVRHSFVLPFPSRQLEVEKRPDRPGVEDYPGECWMSALTRTIMLHRSDQRLSVDPMNTSSLKPQVCDGRACAFP